MIELLASSTLFKEFFNNITHGRVMVPCLLRYLISSNFVEKIHVNDVNSFLMGQDALLVWSPPPSLFVHEGDA